MQGYTPLMMAAPGPGHMYGLPMMIFDFDGTLVDSMKLCVTELRETFLDMGLHVPPEEKLRSCNGPSHEEAAVLLGLPEELRAEFLRIRGEKQMQYLETYQKIYPGVREMLSGLSACAHLCIVSNSAQRYIDRSLSNWGITQYFTRAQGSVPGRTKGRLIGELLRERRPERAMMAGDRGTDIAAGRENGLFTVAACYGFGSPGEWQDADRKAQTVEDLMDICLEFCQR